MSTDVSEVHAASIIRAMMEAARTSETSVDIQLRIRQYIPEDWALDRLDPELSCRKQLMHPINKILWLPDWENVEARGSYLHASTRTYGPIKYSATTRVV
jgi:hypothetical protein